MPATTHQPDRPAARADAAWDGSAAHAHALLPALAGAIDPRDGFRLPIVRVAGLAARTDADGRVHAAAVLMTGGADGLAVAARHQAAVVVARADGDIPPSFRLVPALRAALAGLPHAPDLVLVDGHGTADQRGFGVAAHLGVAADLPAIGVAGEADFGSGPAPHETRGAYTALRDGSRRQVGWLLRSRPGAAPLAVSPAHRVALASSADLVMRFTAGDRWPEPLRLARQLLRTGTTDMPGPRDGVWAP